MKTEVKTTPEVLEHNLNQYFPELLKFESIEETEKSAVYQEIREKVEEILNAVVVENFAQETSQSKEIVETVAWNIERGRIFEGILDALKNHQQLKDKDLYLLTELDYGMIRSGNRNVPQEIARELKLNYAFAPVYIALQKGSGIESEFEGENNQSIHGLAIFSKYPLKNIQAVALPNGKDKMIGKEKRLGYLRALIADVEHPAGTFRAVTVHLDVHCSRKHRVLQVKIILDYLKTLPEMPTVFGGDFNTTTYNAQNARHAILGFWHRVMMGTKNVVENHYPHPDRRFEKGIFDEFQKHGFSYKDFNEIGVGTLHYDMENAAYNTNLGDWVPKWCFPFIFWASRKVGGKFSMRLDWFFGKNIEIAPNSKPQTIGNLKDEKGTPLSDHDAIGLDFVLK